MQTQFPDKRIGYAGQPSTPTPDQIPNQELTNPPQEQGVPSLEQRRKSLIDSLFNSSLNS